MVNDGTSATAQAVTLVWNDDSNGWTAVTGQGADQSGGCGGVEGATVVDR